eukprot:c17454_g1_i1.p1 GENE.c17454_g1_i1~~c17454_g1_i1.p1  ORF type:complete len:417 (+),score=146.79 c17454_g1_i1:44-1294(+)
MVDKVFITVSELSELLNSNAKESVFLVDSRTKIVDGRIPNSVFMTWKELAQNGGAQNGLLLETDKLQEFLRNLGLNNNDIVVVYGGWNKGWGEDGRLFWMFHYLGCNVRCLQGGFDKWRETQPTIPVNSPQASRPKGNFVPAPVAQRKISLQELESRVQENSKHVRVVDCRSVGEYEGKRMGYDKRDFMTGHIPRAVSCPWTDLIDSNGNLIPKSQVFEKVKIDPSNPPKEVICYCTGGVRAGFGYMVLQAYGVQNVRNYDGSWWEWAEMHPKGELIETFETTETEVEGGSSVQMKETRMGQLKNSIQGKIVTFTLGLTVLLLTIIFAYIFSFDDTHRYGLHLWITSILFFLFLFSVFSLPRFVPVPKIRLLIGIVSSFILFLSVILDGWDLTCIIILCGMFIGINITVLLAFLGI